MPTDKDIEARQKRLQVANEMIKVIASCGRKFFAHTTIRIGHRSISQLELDDRGRVWLVDGYTGKRIYTHARPSMGWLGFSEGGTLQDVIIRLRKFIMHGEPVARVFGPWADWICGGDLWGYGDDMQIVRDGAQRLGIHKASD